MGTPKKIASCVAALVLLTVVPPSSQQAHENVEMIYVGLSDSKAFFTANFQHHFIGAMDLCHVKGMVPGTIDSDKENDVVIEFFKNINNPLPEPRALWLTATDHDEEGTYKWIDSKVEVSYANWSSDTPSGNTSVNCLTINGQGVWLETECHENRTAYPLCEMHKYKPQTILHSSIQTERKLHPNAVDKLRQLMQDETLITIGPVGNKYFFAENTTVDQAEENHFFEIMDLCHGMGLRLAEPETQEEHDFLRNVSLQHFLSNPKLPYLYTVAVTDMVTYNCFTSNAYFRGFYSGEAFPGQSPPGGNFWRYRCGYLTPGGVDSRDCDGPWSPFLCQLVV